LERIYGIYGDISKAHGLKVERIYGAPKSEIINHVKEYNIPFYPLLWVPYTKNIEHGVVDVHGGQ